MLFKKKRREPLRVGVMISGRGSNLQAIIDNCEKKRINARVVVVVSDQPDAYGLKRAERHGIPREVVIRSQYPSKEAFEHRIAEILNSHRVKLLLLAGYMRLVGKTILDSFPGRIMNIHPSLLPVFPGFNAQKKALDHGVRYSGCTVHFVDSGVDTGPIILQVVVPVRQEDTEETLSVRILKEEHRIYSEAVGLFADGCLEIRGRHVIIKDH